MGATGSGDKQPPPTQALAEHVQSIESLCHSSSVARHSQTELLQVAQQHWEDVTGVLVDVRLDQGCECSTEEGREGREGGREGGGGRKGGREGEGGRGGREGGRED